MFKEISFLCGVAFLIAPLFASAQSVYELQLLIQQLQQQINTLSAQRSPSSATSNTVAVGDCVSLNRNLSLNSEDSASNGEVSKLQQFLLSEGVYPEARITGFFGPATQRALQAWQAKAGIVSSGSPSTNGFGSAGPRTRAAIAARCHAPSGPTTYDTTTALLRHQAEVSPQVSCGNGNDFYDGGGDFDTLTYSGRRDEFHITRHSDGSYTIKDLVSCRADTDTVINIEQFVFSDGVRLIETLQPEVTRSARTVPPELQAKREQAQRGLGAVEFEIFYEFRKLLNRIKSSTRTDIPNLKTFVTMHSYLIDSTIAELPSLPKFESTNSMSETELDALIQKLARIVAAKQTLLLAYNALSPQEVALLDTNSQSTSRDERRISDLKQLQLALELYYDIHGTYPVGFTEKGSTVPGVLGILTTKNLISTIPTDPSSKAPYTYASRENGKNYVLSAILETTAHASLTYDIDGNVAGDLGIVGCDDSGRILCVAP